MKQRPFHVIPLVGTITARVGERAVLLAETNQGSVELLEAALGYLGGNTSAGQVCGAVSAAMEAVNVLTPLCQSHTQTRCWHQDQLGA